MLAIKSVFAKEYSGRMCLASHDDTLLFPASEEPKNGDGKNQGPAEEEKAASAPKKVAEVAPKPPREVRTYRV